jgi:hypothetical protein
MTGFSSHLREEGRALRSRLGIGRAGGYRVILLHVALVAVFGVLLPWWYGLQFLDPVTLAAYTCLGVLFAAPAAAQAFVRPERPSWMEAMARVAAAVAYGECMAVAFLSAGLVTVYATHWHGLMLAPDVVTLATAGALGLTGSLALAAGAAWITLRFSAGVARGALRVVFLSLLFLFFFRSRWLPDVAGIGAVVCLAVAVLMLIALRTEVTR